MRTLLKISPNIVGQFNVQCPIITGQEAHPMQDDFRNLRLQQLARSLSVFEAARQEARPQRGWLRAIREGLGLSLEDVGKRQGQSRRRIQEFETAEAKDRITLHSLRRVAAATADKGPWPIRTDPASGWAPPESRISWTE